MLHLRSKKEKNRVKSRLRALGRNGVWDGSSESEREHYTFHRTLCTHYYASIAPEIQFSLASISAGVGWLSTGQDSR